MLVGLVVKKRKAYKIASGGASRRVVVPGFLTLPMSIMDNMDLVRERAAA